MTPAQLQSAPTSKKTANAQTLVLGAVATDPKAGTIWDGFKAWFEKHGLSFDYILYSNYERQVEGLLSGQSQVAWNSPLAWVRTARLARARGQEVEALAMRDTDRDLTSVIVVRTESAIDTLDDLRGKTVAVGAVDSPQATLIPLLYLRLQGLVPEVDFRVRYHDRLAGKHGGHSGGEREAARALMAGEVDAACIIDCNHQIFLGENTLRLGATKVLFQTGRYDHCNFTVAPDAPPDLIARFKAMVLGMSSDDPELRPLFDLAGLKAWKPGRTEGYAALEKAVDEFGFYDADGNITADNYRY